MKITIRRAQGLWIALVIVLAMGVAGTTAASAAPVAQASGLTVKQKRAKATALRKCNRRRSARAKRACRRQVVQRYRRIAKRQQRPRPPAGKTYTVGVMDNYFAPALLQLKTNDWIAWDWRYSTSREGHDVSMLPPFPKGVIRTDILSTVMSGPTGRFKRQFTKPGTYSLYCTLHKDLGMTMTVRVSK